MGQHFTESARKRNLDLARLSETDAYALMQQIRFADNNGDPYCPYCFARRVSWRSDRRWLCTNCRRTFSVFSGTVWHHNRKPLLKLLMIVARFVKASAASPAPDVCDVARVSLKATYLTMMKLREALALHSMSEMLDGICEADGCAIGGYKRKLSDRALQAKLQARRLWVAPPKQILCVLRKRNGFVLTAVHMHEVDFIPFIRKHLARGSELHVDMASGYEQLSSEYTVHTINHSLFRHTDDASTNCAEAFFRRVRKANKAYVHISGVHLDLYGAELAFRESYCRSTDAEKFLRMIAISLRQPVSRRFKGFYQRRRSQ